MRTRVIHLVNPKTDSLTTRPLYLNRALYSPLAGLLAVAACKATPPAGKHSSVGETAEIKSAIKDKHHRQESGRCNWQNDGPTRCALISSFCFDSSFVRSSRKFFFQFDNAKGGNRVRQLPTNENI